jgi:MFS family permease
MKYSDLVKLRDRIPDRNVWLIYAAIFTLGLAYGVSLAIVSLFLKAKGYEKSDIGSLAVWFALGIVALSLPMDGFIRRFSARTTLIASLFGYAVAVSCFPIAPTYASIAGIRAIDGACSVGIWVSCETILLSRSSKENKAFVTSLYAMAMATGYILGPLLAKGILSLSHAKEKADGTLPLEPMRLAFFTSGGIAVVAALLVLFRLDGDIAPEGAENPTATAEEPGTAATGPAEVPGYGAVLWRIKNSCFATFVYGYFQASLVLFLPLYLAESKGVKESSTILVPAFFAAGMMLFTNVFARVGDKHGHLPLMRVLAVIGTLMVLGFVFLDDFRIMCAAVFVAGASLASISPLSLALQGVSVRPIEYSRANAVYNVFYAGGMLLGPPISSRIFQAKGGIPMLYHLAALWVAFVVFSIVFRKDDPRVTGSVAVLNAGE